ncbi:MAG TPA: glycosyltransferase family 4 protein [Candidatus Dormibacteraeota bacterium]|jgi:glycosyltransferase involved in cell wall biosynthesis|nr:glycosyltransferase family 4 protein [Candidatus Dormibacteraeota bacterium]
MGRTVRSLRIGLFSPFFGSTIGGGEKYLGVTAETLRDRYPQHRLEIISSVAVPVRDYEQMLGLDLSGIQFRVLEVPEVRIDRRIQRLPIVRRYARLYATSRTVSWTRSYDLLISMVYVIPAFSRARRSVMLCQFPYTVTTEGIVGTGFRAVMRRAHEALYELASNAFLGKDFSSFDLIICQSEYVRRWIWRYWERDAFVIHPPIDVPEEEPDWSNKAPMILSVGRFFASGHVKRHDLLVEAFRELCDGGLHGWELHLVGSVQRTNEADMKYLEKIEGRAHGYPIRIHVNAARDVLFDLYRRASIYWHAAGYGIEEEERPIDLEHFGMTTAEAMGFGVVPVVIGRGGQAEVVAHGTSGYLWLTPRELKERTSGLIANPRERLQMGKVARARSLHFTKEKFRRRMEAAVTPFVDELEASLWR